MSKAKYKTCALIPFYCKSVKRDEFAQHVSYLQETTQIIKECGIDRIFIVNDGANVSLEKKDFCYDDLIVLQENMGKAGAVKEGLTRILEENYEHPQLIVQSDYDKDQNPGDIRLLLTRFDERDDLSLVIGDRYALAQPNPLPYRKTALFFQQIIFSKLGYNIQDTVSGLRVYTAEFGKDILNKSKSQRFGMDIEQLIIAFLLGKKVETVPLTYSRQRAESTPANKLLDVMNAILIHSTLLKKKGLHEEVSIMSNIAKNIEKKEEPF